MSKKTGQYDIPFDLEGNLLHYAYPKTYAYMQDKYAWKPNFEFEDTLEYVGYARGRSAAYLKFRSKRNQKNYCMFMTDFDGCAHSLIFGELEGRFTFIKRGQNYGLQFLGLSAASKKLMREFGSHP